MSDQRQKLPVPVSQIALVAAGLLTLLVLVIWLATVLDNSGDFFHVNRAWTVQGPGGSYGLLESEGTRPRDVIEIVNGETQGHKDNLVVYQTSFVFGSLRFSFPSRVPVVMTLASTLFALLACTSYFHFSRKREQPSASS